MGGAAKSSSRTAQPALELAHHHPGRLRLRSDVLYAEDDDADKTELFGRIENAFESIGVRVSVKVNARSGSVLVEYEPGAVDPNVLIDTLASVTNLPPPVSKEERSKLRSGASGATIGAAREVNGLIRDLTGGRADLRAAVPIGLAGLAIFSFGILPGRLPRWDNLVYWAFAVFQALHSADIARTRPKEAGGPTKPTESGAH